MDGIDQHLLSVGKIITNLQTLEFVLRLFLYESVGPKDPSLHLERLSVGDSVLENPVTNYDSLRALVSKVNKRLVELGHPDRVDSSLVDVRDAIAHGRALALQVTGPVTLFKFSRPNAGRVGVSTRWELTSAWLAEKTRRSGDEVLKVVRIAREVGLTCFE